jgi:hypothetical protein
MTDITYQIHVHQYKNGALLGQIKDKDTIVAEIYQEPVLNPKVTLHLLRKQVEMMVWTDKV